MKFLLGTKQAMTQLFDETGTAYPATVLTAGPATVIQVKTKDTDGYPAVQLGFGKKSLKHATKARRGHLGRAGVTDGNFAALKEFRLTSDEAAAAFTVGQKIDAAIFTAGEAVEVSGLSKGKGFQGVVKRHGFHGGSRTHGQKHSEREPGSIGGGGRAGGRVAKGIRMAGRMGGGRVTVKNLTVLVADPVANQLVVKGAVPGRRGSLLLISAA